MWMRGQGCMFREGEGDLTPGPSPAQRGGLRQDEVQVAELVPEIVLPQGLRVGEAQVRAPRERFEHGEMAGLRLVERSQHASDGAQAARWRNVEARPTHGSSDR